jgi:uncharacterized NAD(P)/FAD-binding protein YdhS
VPEPRLRVAIVGQGPKGTFALERLLDHSTALEASEAVVVDLFEPHHAPGAGPVYDPAQPEYLRMNFPAARIDMWVDSSEVVPASQRLPFTAWAREMGQRVEQDSYPSRALVGRYLSDGHEAIRRHSPSHIEVQLRCARVDSVDRAGASWVVWAGGRRRDYDEVLIATGHETRSADSLEASWNHAVPLVASVFPASGLSSGVIKPGSTLAVRGFGLSFIDAVLALTEGRGGSFEQTEHPYRLRYLPSSDEPARILPFSRTGRPMLPKPSAGIGVPGEEMARIAATGRARVLGLSAGFSFTDDLLGAIADTAAQAFMLTRTDASERGGLSAASRRVRGLLEGASRGVEQIVGIDPVEEIENGLAVGAGLRAPDLQWAVGGSWRALYPALVERLGGHGLRDDDWPSFHSLARQVERLAFGPAPLNAAKLLALIAAGRVVLRHVVGGRLTSADGRTWLASDSGTCEVDLVLDAVLPNPGAEGNGGLLGQLVEDGYARVAPGRRGLEVRPDGGCIGGDGTHSRGLSAVGRPTEDWVIGNDTLDRSLHSLADRWAERVIERCRQDGPVIEQEAASTAVGV